MHLPKTGNEAKAIVHLLIGLTVVVIAIVLVNKFIKMGSGLLEGLGLKDDKNETANNEYINNKVDKENAAGSRSAWNPNFYKNSPAGSSLFTQAKTDGLVKQIWDSVGYLYDTPTLAAGAIKQCNTKTQVSWLAFNFNKKHGLDLLTWLQSKFDTSEQKEILSDLIRYVDNLPNYK